VQVTASFGVACALQPDALLEGLLQGSDRALYAAKESGRNRVVVDGE
jgi:diguanylate cyclase (GGDEF)-like protein